MKSIATILAECEDRDVAKEKLRHKCSVKKIKSIAKKHKIEIDE